MQTHTNLAKGRQYKKCTSEPRICLMYKSVDFLFLVISMLVQLNDCIGGLLHVRLNVITFRAVLCLGPNVITFRTLLHLGQLLHLGLQQRLCWQGL